MTAAVPIWCLRAPSVFRFLFLPLTCLLRLLAVDSYCSVRSTMTHLETYLDCLKLLPGDLARDMALLSSLDSLYVSTQQQLHIQQQQLLELLNNRRSVIDLPVPSAVPAAAPPSSSSSSTSASSIRSAAVHPSQPPLPSWLSLLSSIRLLEQQCESLSCEKVAVCRVVREGISSYSARLDDETALFRGEMGEEMTREAEAAAEGLRSAAGHTGGKGAAKSGFGFKVGSGSGHSGSSSKGAKGRER